MHSAMTAWELTGRNHVFAAVLFKAKSGKGLGTIDSAIFDRQDEADALAYYDSGRIEQDFANFFGAMVELWSSKYRQDPNTGALCSKIHNDPELCVQFEPGQPDRVHHFPWLRLSTDQQYLRSFINLMKNT
jgi:hypothetical protein